MVHEWMSQHPQGYFPLEKMLDKTIEERKEMEEALRIYKESPTEENLKELKIEVGDLLFAIICLMNVEGISLDECVKLTMEKK